MRSTYDRTDETFNVLSAHLGEFADEADKDVSYFNKLKNGVEPDPFARFVALFRIGCRTTAPVEIWLRKLQAIYAKSRRLHVPADDISGKILEKLESDADAMKTIFSALQDRKLDKAECHWILAELEKNSSIIGAITQAVEIRLGELDETEKRGLRAA